MRISEYISMVWRNRRTALAVAFVCCGGMRVLAQTANPGEPQKPTKYVAVEVEKPKLLLFQGFTLSADVFGPLVYAFSDYGNIEAALRLNLKNTYFPIAEVGYGLCDKTDLNTYIKYKTSAPYLRIGCDVNFLKDKFQDNRLFVGLRYGVSSFNYDISGPDMKDPIYGGAEPFGFDGISTTSQWIEIVLGVQVKVWRNFHMGWSVRFKSEMSTKESLYAKPYYIPGYGTTTGGTVWGGTYNLIFDLNWGKKKGKVTATPVNVEVREAISGENTTKKTVEQDAEAEAEGL